ncbi:glycoside hydrolase family 76 protein [Gracilibacillus sp. D59]|uniref:glycoside hydrolase family 76 protein n=1 Tax=Gracilibacillus sp. D59 TaxID=3457434 RepID=UPI003FCCCAD9
MRLKCHRLTMMAVTCFLLFSLFSLNIVKPNYSHAATSWSEEYDASQGTLHNLVTENSETGYFGNGYVAGWNEDGQSVEINVTVPNDGNYTLVFKYSAAAGQASRYLEVNGEGVVDQVRFSGTGSWGDWQTTYLNDVYLTAGTNTISLSFVSDMGSVNWLNYDSLLVKEQGEEQLVSWGLTEEAELAQASLTSNFWNTETNMFNNQYPYDENNNQFHYWWQAHAIDTLIDGYERTDDYAYIDQAIALYEAVKARNGGDIRNDFYDDMLWMALALQRLHDYTNNQEHEEAVITLWEDIKTGWSSEFGGGIAWNKNQLDYKNTPSNAPAVILATRLYQDYGNEEDLQWAKDIYNWVQDTLVDPSNGLVWDGINRTGDGNIDKNWEFTYNQGVYIGASVELYQLTGEKEYLDEAIQTAETTKERFSNHNQIIYEGGSGDGGLFKGILVRYMTELVKTENSQVKLAEWIVNNAKNVWNQTNEDPEILFGSSWEGTINLPVELSQQLSGVMLMEHATQLEPIIVKNVIQTLQEQIDSFVDESEITSSLAKKLSNHLEHVNHHINKGNMKQVIKHLKDFHKHVQKGKIKDQVSEIAYRQLQGSLDTIIH